MESFDTLQFWLASTIRGFCALAVDSEQLARNGSPTLVDPGNRWFNLAAADGDSFAFLVSRPSGPDAAEFGTHAYGPHAQGIAEAMAEQVRIWDQSHRTGTGPEFTIWSKSTPDYALTSAVPGGLVIDKRHSRITISWPGADVAPGRRNP